MSDREAVANAIPPHLSIRAMCVSNVQESRFLTRPETGALLDGFNLSAIQVSLRDQ